LNAPTDSVKVKIFTVAFRKVYEDTAPETGIGQHLYAFDLAKVNSFANGLYFVVVYWKSGENETQQIMKLLIRR
jgi:hypothetical protein